MKLMPKSYAVRHGQARRVELSSDRTFRARNTPQYRLAHWPIWIWVFFIAPGPITFDLFAHGFDRRMALWLAAVLAGTGIAGLSGKLPGRSEEHTSELQSRENLVCRLLLEKKKKKEKSRYIQKKKKKKTKKNN